ncbi:MULTISPECIES: low molecular weight protein-tyrosine-phosphatase [unclassified Pseudomonas]|uniref:low molecular weight protein-tyrosine-phosphatase n=1 Tax=unclassified Pseudomonas TaxID=196821 RepID=UPI0014728C94|nr:MULTISPECIES: low molecular weight protein-tyrosine-phosphatase [unclassified Pseudomonas]NMY38840.1 low molecular weight phosphotyrosine protein phosphatase [Pseudomonas sp. WS 5078]NMY61756.1 low molecular weight phosphotyrosine protein phosphatase [Pseudomonas sp. WS 5354]NMY76369.1 low molecular weight phosphotyrosine protein phosphatase [Pseudomonas sp. WS 5071]
MRVLFVCLGNICRSPTAEGVLRHKLQQAGLERQVEVASAGTGGWHAGEPPDKRTQRAAQLRGYDLSQQRAQQVRVQDFERYDLILAMDNSNFRDLQAMQPANGKAELDVFLRRYKGVKSEVPDPYYDGEQGFVEVLDLIEAACDGLMIELKGRV